MLEEIVEVIGYEKEAVKFSRPKGECLLVGMPSGNMFEANHGMKFSAPVHHAMQQLSLY